MSDGLYNNNIDLTPEDFYVNNGSSTSIDDSTQENPIYNWVIDHDTDSGTPGVTPSTPGTPDQQEVLHAVTMQVRKRYGIPSYDPDDLLAYHNAGAIFYVKYTDGTEEVCDYTDVYNPIALASSTYVNEAAAIANAINQYFWHDDNGAHVTDVVQEDWTTAVAASFSDLSNNKPYHNILMNSLGILLRSALNNLVSLSRSGIVFYDGTGNDISHMLSSFGTIGATFREAGKTKATVTSQGLTVYDNSGTISNGVETIGSQVAFIGVDVNNKPYSRIGKSAKGYIEIGVNANNNGYIDFYNGSTLLGHIGYDAGIDNEGNTVNAPYYNFGIRTSSSTIGNYSIVEGSNNTASGYCSHAEGKNNTASGGDSHAEGYNTTAIGYYSHAEGHYTTASGTQSHSEGGSTTASGNFSHSEGGSTTASGNYSHAEGFNNTASGLYSHAEGNATTAKGKYSHSEGYNTEAIGDYSHAEGYHTSAIGYYSHAEGYHTSAIGYYSHTEGRGNKASESYSHAEGYVTTASGYESHSEGDSTTASGNASHAEGNSTTASGNASHTEGISTTAIGNYSHASGYHTSAGYAIQFVCGKYNSNNSSDLFEIGNGSSDSSTANAFRVTTSNTAYMGSTAVNSDQRIKTDLGILDISEATDFVKSLIPHKYEKFGRKELGFFAQDVEKDPNYGNILVEQYEDYGYTDFRSLSYDGMIAPIVSVEQNLIDRVETLEKENSKLKDENKQLNERIFKIEKVLGI